MGYIKPKKGQFNIKYFHKGKACKPFAHLFVDKFKIAGSRVYIEGWAYSPNKGIDFQNLTTTLGKYLLHKEDSLERTDIALSMDEDISDSNVGFLFEFRHIAPWANFKLRFDFSNEYYIELTLPIPRLIYLKYRLLKGFLYRFKQQNKIEKKRCSIPTHSKQISAQVILPVFNSHKYLIKLLPKLIADKQVKQIIIIDDASTSKSVCEYLRNKAEQYAKILLLKNNENKGYVASINKGMQYADDDFVILNTDIDIPENWLTRLLEPIKSNDDIASTTPFTNSGTILSFPQPQIDNDIFNNLPVADIDQAFDFMSFDSQVDLPTGVGFCMGVSKAALDKIGLFDEELFGRGYGEENDWCQRACKGGYRNVAVTNLYVYHRHGASFNAGERKELIRDGLNKLSKKHSNYTRDVQKFIIEDKLREYRNFALNIILSKHYAKSVELIVDHQMGGGANKFRDQIIQNKLEDSEDILVLLLTYDNSKRVYVLRTYHHLLLDIDSETSLEVDSLEQILAYLHYFNISQIVINNLVFYPSVQCVLNALKILKQVNGECTLDLYLHDYFSVCQSHNLLNSQGDFCGVPSGVKTCNSCQGRSNIHIHNREKMNIVEWREMWSALLLMVDRIKAFSFCSAGLFLRAYPEFEGKLIIEPHGKYFRPDFIPERPELESVDKVKVGIVGSIGYSKGAEIIAKLSHRSDVEVVVIGNISPQYIKKLSKETIVHGQYERDTLPELIEKYQIHSAFVSSIWPETYNLVTDELMDMDIPILAFDLGAHAERIKEYSKGRVIPITKAQDLNEIVGELKSLMRG